MPPGLLFIADDADSGGGLRPPLIEHPCADADAATEMPLIAAVDDDDEIT